MLSSRTRLSSYFLAVCILVGVHAVPASGAELEAQTLRAYEAYVEQARRQFFEHMPADSFRWSQNEAAARMRRLASGAIIADPGHEDGIIAVPGGLVHHWTGVVFIPKVTLNTVLDLSTRIEDYPAVYTSVKASRLLGREGDTYRILFRIEEHAGAISATLDLWTTVRYVRVDRTRAYSISTATEIREVEDAGKSSERLLAAGKDRGYLWQASTFTKMVERDNGVYVELETFGLSRGFPAFLGWIIEPIARRLGRKSVELSLKEFRDGIMTRAGARVVDTTVDPFLQSRCAGHIRLSHRPANLCLVEARSRRQHRQYGGPWSAPARLLTGA